MFPNVRYARYVAIGDSTVEGLDDPDGHGSYRGWANRLAERIAREQGSIQYANLAIRGRTTRQVRAEQLAPALAMKPELAAVVSGTNDLLRRHFDAAALFSDIEAIQRPLIDAGATVITFTLPDLGDIMPIARMVRRRLHEMNDPIGVLVDRSGDEPVGTRSSASATLVGPPPTGAAGALLRAPTGSHAWLVSLEAWWSAVRGLPSAVCLLAPPLLLTSPWQSNPRKTNTFRGRWCTSTRRRRVRTLA